MTQPIFSGQAGRAPMSGRTLSLTVSSSSHMANTTFSWRARTPACNVLMKDHERHACNTSMRRCARQQCRLQHTRVALGASPEIAVMMTCMTVSEPMPGRTQRPEEAGPEANILSALPSLQGTAALPRWLRWGTVWHSSTPLRSRPAAPTSSSPEADFTSSTTGPAAFSPDRAPASMRSTSRSTPTALPAGQATALPDQDWRMQKENETSITPGAWQVCI